MTGWYHPQQKRREVKGLGPRSHIVRKAKENLDQDPLTMIPRVFPSLHLVRDSVVFPSLPRHFPRPRNRK